MISVRRGACALGILALLAGCSSGTSTVRHSDPPASSPAPASSQDPASSPAPASTTPNAPTVHTAQGTLLTVDLPGATSHFPARPAEVWVPRGASDRARVPVLMLLHGTGGGPTDWIAKGHIVSVVDAFAASHHGQAPLIVLPDINGSKLADTECIRTKSGASVEEYLERDVPAGITKRFPVLSAPAHWAIGGLSEGGTCAIMIALRDPAQFSTFVDLSGLSRPTLGDSDIPARTIPELFDGSTANFDEHDPVWLMSHHDYPELSGWLECGAQDTAVLAAQQSLAGAARQAHLPVVLKTVPGKHSWTVWTVSITSALPWVWSRIE